MRAASCSADNFQTLPGAGPEREALRETGQFWTPPWLAKAMAAWVVTNHPDVIFDPAVGPGTFFAAARAVGFKGHFDGFELHEEAFKDGWRLGLNSAEFERVIIGDFIGSRISRNFPAIISNPPYIRHHRLGEAKKAELRQLAEATLGFALDGRIGLHLYFLLKCLGHLSPGGKLAFILPADVCEGVSSAAVWNRMCGQYCLEAVLTFEESAAPFPKVDTNAMVFLMSGTTPRTHFRWLNVRERDTFSITETLAKSSNGYSGGDAVICYERELSEALQTGLSRPPRAPESRGVPLLHFARVVRGIATGANEFFFLTLDQVEAFGLDARFFVRAVGRTRDCRDDVLRLSRLAELEREGRPTWLMNLGNVATANLPPTMRAYLDLGEQQKFNKRALIQSRRPWYKMEQRTPPPILFAYLGRRDCRFILNEASVVPLTGFLCVYPWDSGSKAVKTLWRALNHPTAIRNLLYSGKSYGGGAVKVEPRQLETLEIPDSVLHEVGLAAPSVATEMLLLEEPNKKRNRSGKLAKGAEA
jgi:hypothetical protein